jgi:hypothetical protein
MPFATKFRAMMDLPVAGDTVGGFAVESVDVGHHSGGPGQYAYAVRIVLRGAGGQQGVRRAFKAMFAAHTTTFSGYGTPYQLWFGAPRVESLGDRRYAVSIEGAGARVFLEQELHRFLDDLDAAGYLAAVPDPAARETMVETYMEQYRVQVKRNVDRYRRRLRKASDGDA